jgi:hypothetical protein
MRYVSAGAVLLGFNEETGEDTRTNFKYKKDLAAALKECPEQVLITNFSYRIGPGEQEYRGSELDPTLAYQVAGPDAETKRTWSARVEVQDGKPVITA